MLNEETYMKQFWRKVLKKVTKYLDIFQSFRTLAQLSLEPFNQIHMLAVHQCPLWEVSCQHREKLWNSLRNQAFI